MEEIGSEEQQTNGVGGREISGLCKRKKERIIIILHVH